MKRLKHRPLMTAILAAVLMTACPFLDKADEDPPPP
jgi:hypothetical protein